MSIAVYPGSFDPITNGHVDIIKRTCALFDHCVVGVLINERKKPLLLMKDRIDLINAVIREQGITNCTCEGFSGLLVNFTRKCGANVIIRGIRDASEFPSEYAQATMNRSLGDGVETLFMPASAELCVVSSSAVREILAFGGDIDKFVPNCVVHKLSSM